MPAILLALVLTAPAPKASAKPALDQAIIGEWIVEQEVSSGKPILNVGQPAKVTITRDRFKSRIAGVGEWGLTINAKKDPPQIDLWDLVRKKVGTKGIYKIEGDTLIIYYRFGDDRPAKFESLPKSGVRMMSLKRVNKH